MKNSFFLDFQNVLKPIFFSSSGTGSSTIHFSQSHSCIAPANPNTMGTLFWINRKNRFHHIRGKFFFSYIICCLRIIYFLKI